MWDFWRVGCIFEWLWDCHISRLHPWILNMVLAFFFYESLQLNIKIHLTNTFVVRSDSMHLVPLSLWGSQHWLSQSLSSSKLPLIKTSLSILNGQCHIHQEKFGVKKIYQKKILNFSILISFITTTLKANGSFGTMYVVKIKWNYFSLLSHTCTCNCLVLCELLMPC